MSNVTEDQRHCDCILPFYNEGNRVLSVLNELSKCQYVHTIIAVDDGSDDGMSEVIEANYPHVHLTRLRENRGKTAAIAEGVNQSDASYLLLIDADLLHLQAAEIDNAIRYVTSHSEIDMLLLRRQRPVLQYSPIPIDVIISGERILRRNDLKIILQQRLVDFQIEVATNTYMIDQGKHVQWMQTSAMNPHKIQKLGFFRGSIADVRMYRSLFKLVGIWAFIKQTFHFRNNQISL